MTNAVNVADSMILGNAQLKVKDAFYAIDKGTLQVAARIKRGDNSPISHLVFSGTIKPSTQPPKQKLRPVVKVHMVNEQGDYEGDAHWDVVDNSIGPINYTDSVDLV